MRRGVGVVVLALGFAAACARLADAQPTEPVVGEAPPVAPETPAPVEAPAGPRDLMYAHAEVGAFGTIDITSIRHHPGFGALVIRTLARHGVSATASGAVVRVLEHTRTLSGTLAFGPGETAVVATLVLRGDYGPNEVPDAFHDILPGLARGLWFPTRIDGHRAFDLGLAALIEIEPGAWLISRRIDGNLALGTRDLVPSALREEVIEAGVFAAPSTGYAALVGPRATVPGNEPPQAMEDLFHGPAHGVAALRFEDGRAVVDIRASLHHRSDAGRWHAAYGGWLASMAQDLGVPEETVNYRIQLEGTVLHGHVSLEPVAVDAFVARLSGGRLLTTPPAPPSAPSESQSP